MNKFIQKNKIFVRLQFIILKICGRICTVINVAVHFYFYIAKKSILMYNKIIKIYGL